MVNRGRSQGCNTCKQRRVKCDEAKPECRRCRGLGVRCEGYTGKPLKVKFRDENHRFYTLARTHDRPLKGQQRSVEVSDKAAAARDKFIDVTDKSADGLDEPVDVQDKASEVHDEPEEAQTQAVTTFPRTLAEPDTSVPFFLWHYASIGRDMESGRGFFEMLVPVYSTQRENSALSLAVSAVASEIHSVWRHHTDSFRSPRKSYAQAVSCLRRAVQDPTERRDPATVFAALILQLHENIAAVLGLRAAARIHQNGAASLLAEMAKMNDVNGVMHEHVRRFMLHTEIAAAMRQKRPLRPVAYSWIGSKDLMAAPDNPSSTLDAIGVRVAELQANYIRQSTQDDLSPSSHESLKEFMAEAKRIDEQLLVWAESVPDHWNPRRLKSGQHIDSSIPTYRFLCEVYPSCPVANLWNLWRFQRFILAKITLGSLNTNLCQSQIDPADDQHSPEIEELFGCAQTIQELVDSVCYSIPFYLGNRTGPSSFTDFTDPEILLPSYHAPSSPESSLGEPIPSKTQSDEHRRHVIAQGAWHAMSPLSRLLTLFSDEHGPLITSFLRPGQHEWIREQFLRVTTLLGLPSVKLGNYKEVGGTWNWSAERVANTGAEDLARTARQGAAFINST